MSRKEAAPAKEEDTSSCRIIDHFGPHEECNGHDPQQFRSNNSAAKDTTFLEEAGIFSYRTIGREERLGYPVATFLEFNSLYTEWLTEKHRVVRIKCPPNSLRRHQKSFESG